MEKCPHSMANMVSIINSSLIHQHTISIRDATWICKPTRFLCNVSCRKAGHGTHLSLGMVTWRGQNKADSDPAREWRQRINQDSQTQQMSPIARLVYAPKIGLQMQA